MSAPLNRATEQIHIAVQFLAMAGKYYVAEQDDDGHTNMDWHLPSQQFVGQSLNEKGHHFSLRPSDLRLAFGVSEDDPLSHFYLASRHQEEGLEWMRQQLSSIGLDPEELRMDLHYDVPSYFEQANDPFAITDDPGFKLFSAVRSLGKEIIHEYFGRFKAAQADRTWPHHFDHGCYAPLQKEDAEVIRSISFGLAIQDDIVDGHYFYVTHWSKDSVDYDYLTKLPHGFWSLEALNGAALPVDEAALEQDGDVRKNIIEFMDGAISISKNLLKVSK